MRTSITRIRKLTEDPYMNLLAAILWQAFSDAKRGNRRAIHWLLDDSERGGYWYMSLLTGEQDWLDDAIDDWLAEFEEGR